MQRHNTEPAIPSQASVVSSTQSSSTSAYQSLSSFGSTATEVRRADQVFDQIEDSLTEMMADHEQRRLHCRVLQGHLNNEEPKQAFTAIVIVMPPAPK